MKIELFTHEDIEEHVSLLDSQDIYNFVGENTCAEAEFALFIHKFCEYLNYPFVHNDEMKFADEDLCVLRGWIDGYACAKHLKIQQIKGALYKIKYGQYSVILHSPYIIRRQRDN